jgi:hypothetical protein
MAAAVAVNVTSARTAGTIAITGATASTTYVIEITDPSGPVSYREATTDGSGAATVPYVPMTHGSVSVAIRPKAERTGTTTAVATGSGTVTRFN